MIQATAQLHNWFRLGARLHGEIHEDTATHGKHPFPNGTEVTTSPVQRIEGDYAHTLTGTVYRLVNHQSGKDAPNAQRDEAPKHEGLPVAGYRPQSAENVALVNGFKADEERLLRKLDEIKNLTTGMQPSIDARWLSIGRTHLEQAFMAINRSVFQPARVTLPDDN